MHDGSQPSRPIRSLRARLLAAAALAGGTLLAGCGGGSAAPTIASVTSSTTSTSTAPLTAARTSSRSSASTGAGATTPSDPQAAALAYSRCMRANGVPSFPDPTASGGFEFKQGAFDPSSPAVKTAQARCQKLMPVGGALRPGAQSDPSPQALATMVKAAQCMRRHGVDNFPDPRTSVPTSLAGFTEISDIDGVILAFPASVDRQSPAFSHAADVCHFPLHNH